MAVTNKMLATAAGVCDRTVNRAYKAGRLAPRPWPPSALPQLLAAMEQHREAGQAARRQNLRLRWKRPRRCGPIDQDQLDDILRNYVMLPPPPPIQIDDYTFED